MTDPRERSPLDLRVGTQELLGGFTTRGSLIAWNTDRLSITSAKPYLGQRGRVNGETNAETPVHDPSPETKNHTAFSSTKESATADYAAMHGGARPDS